MNSNKLFLTRVAEAAALFFLLLFQLFFFFLFRLSEIYDLLRSGEGVRVGGNSGKRPNTRTMQYLGTRGLLTDNINYAIIFWKSIFFSPFFSSFTNCKLNFFEYYVDVGETGLKVLA